MNDENLQFTFEWPVGLPAPEPFFDIAAIARQAMEENISDLADLAPFERHWIGSMHSEAEWMALTIEFKPGSGMPVVNQLDQSMLELLQPVWGQVGMCSHRDLRPLLPPSLFSFSKFTYVGPVHEGRASWQHVIYHLYQWLEDVVVPRILEINEARVRRVIPEPPQFDVGVFDSIWVLECEEEAIQGTAFVLEGVGLVTCHHVLGPRTQAFRANAHHQKYNVRVVRSNATVDLAVLELEGPVGPSLPRGSADELKNFDHVAVAGYPNFNYGDTGRLVPGLVVGFRMASGVRRVLTNASIVSGNSGGPVLGSNNEVIGIAVTGAERMDVADATEKHGFIPVNALDVLN